MQNQVEYILKALNCKNLMFSITKELIVSGLTDKHCTGTNIFLTKLKSLHP